VVAYGKLGGKEKTPTSDMDMAFIYDADEDAEGSDGDKPLSVTQYFARLSQRLINALSAQTAEGTLYEVDMRLRPSGNAGPLATSLKAFRIYQENEAWTWEHMALTRARAVTGSPELRRRVHDVIHETLTARRDRDKLVVDVSDMRLRMDKERHTDIPWEIKDYRGGLVDVEFISQFLQLKHGHDHPDALSPTTRIALENLKNAGVLEAHTAERLMEALELWQSVQGLLRLTVTIDQRTADNYVFPTNLQRQVCRVVGADSCAEAKEHITSTAAWVFEIYRALIDDPAEALRPTVSSDLA